MRIDYTNTVEDIVAWQDDAWKQDSLRRTLRRSWLHVSFTVVLSTILTRLLFAPAFGWGREFGDFAFASVLAFCVTYFGCAVAEKLSRPGRNRALVKRQIGSDELNAFLCSVSVESQPEGLKTVWDGKVSLDKWSEVAQIRLSESLLIVSTNNRLVPIPRRIFGSEAQEQEFIAEIERFRTGAAPASTSTRADSNWWRDRYAVDREDEKVNLGQHHSE